jgi:hypothetical protein
MSKTFRHVWPEPFQGKNWLNLNLPGVVIANVIPRKLQGSIGGQTFVYYTHDIVVSAVVVTASEWSTTEGDSYSQPPVGALHRGDAIITVCNVRPYVRNYGNLPADQGGGVEFVVNVDFPSPLLIATTITVFDEVPTMSY